MHAEKEKGMKTTMRRAMYGGYGEDLKEMGNS